MHILLGWMHIISNEEVLSDWLLIVFKKVITYENINHTHPF